MSAANAVNEKVLPMSRRGWILLAVLGALMLGAYGTGVSDVLSIEAMKARRGDLLSAVEADPFWSASAFFLAYAVIVALSLPAASVMTLLGGFLFGAVLGGTLVVIAATLGATVLFLVARSSFGGALREKAGPLAKRVSAKFQDNAFEYLLFMRLVPLFPFFAVNVAPALLGVGLRTYVTATFIGIIPGTFVYAHLGRELGTIASLGDLVSVNVLVALTLLGLIALLPVAYRKVKSARTGPGVLVALLALTLTAGSVMGANNASAADPQYERFVENYRGLLRDLVRPARKNEITYAGVDYVNWRADRRHAEALGALLASDPTQVYARSENLAYWINAYNFLTIDLIVREGEAQSIKNLGGIFSSPWKSFRWPIGGRQLSLDDIEHGIIRKLGEPRIHFAVNCAAISCPDLRDEPYAAATLDGQLANQVAITFANPFKGYAADGTSVRVSKVMDWYGKDFDGGDVSTWIRENAPVNLPSGARVGFFAYDWALNDL